MAAAPTAAPLPLLRPARFAAPEAGGAPLWPRLVAGSDFAWLLGFWGRVIGGYAHTVLAFVGPAGAARSDALLRAPQAALATIGLPMARLILATAEGQQAIELRPINSLGRHPNNTIQLLDKIVSKEHCILEQRDGH
jgi:hypothetical protein